MKLAVLSNINMDLLKNSLQKGSFQDLYFGGYNQWQSELLNTSSGLYTFSPDIVFLYINADEFNQDISEIFDSISFFSSHNNKTTFIVSNLSSQPYSVHTYHTDKFATETDLNNQLNKFAAQHSNVIILDFHRLVSLYGYKNLFEEKFWYLGRIKLSNLGFNVLAQEIKNLTNALQGKTKKVLILDLDNTLWGGVLGEEGWQNIQLSHEGTGRIYLDLQKNIKALKETGILLAICSKNNEADVKEAFEKNTNQQLQWDDFIAHKINWNNKTDNIIEIAESLSLGLDSFVFIDDNPVERELVKQTLPEVIVPSFPQDIAQLNQWFVNDVVYPYFAKLKLTNEDIEKTTQYKRNIDREEIRNQLNFDDYIQHLNIKLKITEVSTDTIARASQLTQKTNQFNLTGKRYTDTEIESLLQKPDYKLYLCDYEDKFGKEGITGLCIILLEKDKATVDTFLLSCRVLGRKIEFDFLNHIINDLKKYSIKTIEGIYNQTTRNTPAAEFYTDCGFTKINDRMFTLTINE